MKLLVSGREGQAARSLAERTGAYGVEVVLVGRPELDLAEPSFVAPLIAGHKPEAIVSAGAFTAGDKAEIEPERASRINAVGSGRLASAATVRESPIATGSKCQSGRVRFALSSRDWPLRLGRLRPVPRYHREVR